VLFGLIKIRGFEEALMEILQITERQRDFCEGDWLSVVAGVGFI
jgi:hypothetical protein